MKKSLIVLLPLLAVSSALGATYKYTVAGTSDLWLSGAAVGTLASTNDYLSNAAPFLAPTQIVGGATYTFSVTGSVSNTNSGTRYAPDGNSKNFISHDAHAQNGISDITAPMSSLIGVFLNGDVPLSGGKVTALNFNTIGLNFATLSPELNQVFFIGDGLASTKSDKNTSTLIQTFVAPTGATRLFLGTMDGYEWNNNSGSFSVEMTVVPEPATYAALFGIGTLGFVAIRRYLGRKA